MRLKWIATTTALVAALTASGCSDDGIPPTAPPPDPQISQVRVYSKTFNSAGSLNGIQSNEMWHIMIRADDTVWMGSQKGIAIFPSLTATTRSAAWDEQNGLSNPKVRKMVELSGKIYVATWGGGVSIYDIAGDSWSAKRRSSTGLTDDSVADAFVYADQVYFATNGGVSIYDPASDTFTRYTQAQGLLTDLVSAVWVASTPRGEERMYGSRVEFVLQQDELDDFGVTLQRISGSTVYFQMLNSGLVEPNVNDVFYDADDDLWYLCFSRAGIAAVDMDAATWTYASMDDGLPSDLVYGVTKVDGVLWAATRGGIARRRADGSWQGYGKSGGLSDNLTRSIVSDDPQRIWISYGETGAGVVQPSSAQ